MTVAPFAAPLPGLACPDPTLRHIIREGLPQPGLSVAVNRWRRSNVRHLWRGARQVIAARALGLPVVYGALWVRVLRADGEQVDLGLASLRVVTTAGMGFLVDAFQGTAEMEDMRYHGIGTGTNAESSSDTALQTELTTEYNPNGTRATGSLGEGAAANIFRTVGTNTVDASAAITEHGIFSQAAAPGGVLLDRSVFSVINLNSGDSLQSPYEFTATAGS